MLEKDASDANVERAHHACAQEALWSSALRQVRVLQGLEPQGLEPHSWGARLRQRRGRRPCLGPAKGPQQKTFCLNPLRLLDARRWTQPARAPARLQHLQKQRDTILKVEPCYLRHVIADAVQERSHVIDIRLGHAHNWR